MTQQKSATKQIRHSIDWSKISRYESELIDAIAERAVKLYEQVGLKDDKLTITMDLSGAHVVCPIDLAALRDCDDSTFGHDVLGIRRHFNRRTFELEGCFLPRTAVKERRGE